MLDKGEVGIISYAKALLGPCYICSASQLQRNNMMPEVEASSPFATVCAAPQDLLGDPAQHKCGQRT